MRRSLEDLGTPLSEVTFVVLDLETTGGSPAACEITEVGAVKYRGGELLGTFQTLVNPGVALPPVITYLTGITQSMVGPAPLVEAILASLVEFVGDSVIVGHNVRFDLAFLRVAMDRHGWPRFSNLVVDTCALARRLVSDEVSNCKLSTLAAHFRTSQLPTHRALDDARATAEVLHGLLERAGTLGVLGLDDLVALPTVAGHRKLSKLKLAAQLPRRPGVYLFRNASGHVLYVGKAEDLRRRVRVYFSGDSRKEAGQLLREATAIDHIVCSGELEATVLEVRLIHRFSPRFNRRTKHWRRCVYVKLTLDERWPRISVVRRPRTADGCLYLGPLPSSGAARLIAEAIETALPLGRCTARPGRSLRSAACTLAQRGVADCPCAGYLREGDYSDTVRRVIDGLTVAPNLILDPLKERMRTLCAAGRFEEAGAVHDRALALATAVSRQRNLDALRQSGRLHVEVPGEASAVLDGGILRAAWSYQSPQPPGWLDVAPGGAPPASQPLPLQMADELTAVAAWLESRATTIRVVACEGSLASPYPRLCPFTPADSQASRLR